MKSVGNIAKITKAMKMVAASRLRGVQTRMEQSRGLPLPMVKMLGDAPGASGTPLPSTLYSRAGCRRPAGGEHAACGLSAPLGGSPTRG